MQQANIVIHYVSHITADNVVFPTGLKSDW